MQADESQVQQVWTPPHRGQIPCPVDTCQKPIILPTIEEAALLKASAALEASMGESAVGSQPEEPQKAKQPAEDKTPTEVAGASPAPKPAPAPVPSSKLETEAASDPQPESAPVAETTAGHEVAAGDAQTAVSTAPTGTGTKPDIVHGFSGAVDAPMTLEQEASSGRTMAIKTIRHSDCVDGDRDTFDEKVTNFLREQGDGNIDSVNSIQFSDDEKKPIDYGVLIIYKEDLPE